MIVDERMTAFINSLNPGNSMLLDEIEKEALEMHVPVIRKETQSFLKFLVKAGKPGRILEVGTAVGYSALFMMENMPQNARITTVEKVSARLADARRNFGKYDEQGRICLLEGDAAEVLHDLLEQGRQYDLIFMDAAKGQYLNFLPDVVNLLIENGTLISDNIFHEGDVLQSRYAVTRRDRTIHGRMREYLEVLTHHRELETICLPVGDGITISTKKEVAQYEKT